MSDPIDRQAAIEDVKSWVAVDGREKHLQKDVIKWLKELPSAQPERCEYCNEDADGFVTPIEKNGHAFVRFGMNGWELSLKANGWHGSAKIRYCPMCGRELKNDK